MNRKLVLWLNLLVIVYAVLLFVDQLPVNLTASGILYPQQLWDEGRHSLHLPFFLAPLHFAGTFVAVTLLFFHRRVTEAILYAASGTHAGADRRWREQDVMALVLILIGCRFLVTPILGFSPAINIFVQIFGQATLRGILALSLNDWWMISLPLVQQIGYKPGLALLQGVLLIAFARPFGKGLRLLFLMRLPNDRLNP